MIGIIIGIAVGIILFVLTMCVFSWYRIVPPSEAHIVTTPKSKFVASSDEEIGTQKWYFAISEWVPFIGRQIREMDITTKELTSEQTAYEKGQGRYSVKSSTKFRVKDVAIAAETWTSYSELENMLRDVIIAAVRAVTIDYDVENTRAKQQEIEDKIKTQIDDKLAKFGLHLITFQLIDFRDTEDSSIVSDISRKREEGISAESREVIAEKDKTARIKEAEAEELAKEKEILKDRKIAENEQEKLKAIAIKEQLTKEEEYKVKQIETVTQAEITKEAAIIKANELKEVAIVKAEEDREAEEIRKEQKRLEGEGDRFRAEEQAKGEAATTRENGLAEAEATQAKGLAEAEKVKAIGLAEAKTKDELQKALNKFGDEAIKALVAEKEVEKDKAIGIENAKALTNADLKIFAGGKSSEDGFNAGMLLEGMNYANPNAASAKANNIARPNDLGVTALTLANTKELSKKKQTTLTETKK